MPHEITPNGKVGRRAERRQRRKKLASELNNLTTALNNWMSSADYSSGITSFAALKDLYREERRMLRDCAQALRVLIAVELEEMAEED